MKEALKLIFLITYTIIIFLINNWLILGLMFAFNIAIVILTKTKPKQMLNVLYKISPFILISFTLNIFLTNIHTATLIMTRILISFSFVYPYRKTITPMGLAKAVETICCPFKIFGFNPKDVALIVNISVTFVPILARELEQINISLKSKCIQVYGITKAHKKLQYILTPWLYSTFERTSSLEMALKSKGYAE